MLKKALLFIGFSFVLLTRLPALELPVLLSDGAVLQQQRPIPIWGWAEPNATISVTLDQVTLQTVAGADGRWMTSFPAMSYEEFPEPLTLVVKQGSNSIRIEDILLGEVWLCSGQSNMNYKGKTVSWTRTPGIIPLRGERPLARIIQIQPVSRKDLAAGLTPQLRPSAKRSRWSVVGDGSQSAAHWFARGLQQQLGVPVGIVHCALGGSRIESWIAPGAAQKGPGSFPLRYQERVTGMQALKSQVLATDPQEMERSEAMKFARHYPAVNWNVGIHPLGPLALAGVAWYQGESNNGDRAGHYAESLTTLIQSWRAHFQRPKLPFIVVQITSMNTDGLLIDPPATATGTNPRIDLLESQRSVAMADEQVALVPNIDLGGNIHPVQKPDVAARMTLAALQMTYQHDVIASGPVVIGYQRRGSQVTLELAHADKLYAAEAVIDDKAVLSEEGVVLKREARSKETLVFRKSTIPQTVRGLFVRTDTASHLLTEVTARIDDGSIVIDLPEGAVELLGGFAVQQDDIARIGNVYNSADLPLMNFVLPLND